MAESRKPPELDGALILDSDSEELDDDLPESQALPLDHDPREDGKADLASEMLNEILKRMGLTVEVTLREDAEEVINKIVNRFPDGRRHIVLDSGDYRLRRENGLASMARREAKRAVQQSRIITLEPMSPRDRRVIHLSLAKFPGVSTRSDGQGAERRVRIIPARQARPERQPRR